jgi:Caspase domain
MKVVAFATALLCTNLLQPSHAQTKAGTANEARNLQVQAVAPSAATANSNQRVALVIGNAAYKEAPLTNPVNDARAIGQALQESGFTVILRENTDQRGMLSALREFGDKLRGGGTGLFYYAGHGMQIKGRNYLIPVGANVDREDEVAYSAVDAQAVLDKMESAGNAANIMILDACRNNPFVRASRSGQAGLAQMEAPVGTLVAFATSPGAVASDGSGANGLYTQHLLTAMRQNGSKVEDVFKQVRANVRRDSQGKQVPWESTSLEGDFYFKGGASAATTSAVDSSIAVENALWDAVKNTTLPIELRAYLNRYPQGRYAAEANAKLAQLQPGTTARPNAVAPAPSSAKPVAPNSGPSISLNSSAVTVPDASSNGKDQAAIDRRTVELLAGIASASAAAQQAATTPAPKPRPATASNKAGFTVGDRWRFQIVDKFKGEVVNNYVRSIDKVSADGDLVLNKGGVRWDAKGNTRFLRNADRERNYSDGFIEVPPSLRSGAKTDISYEIESKYVDGRVTKEVSKGSMVVKGQETVKTPAGEFQAWKIERETFWNYADGSQGRFIFTGWYVPELRNYVAWDQESRNSHGSINFRDRHELTSFTVRGAENLAQR